MKQSIDIWTGNDKINWLCLFINEFTGKSDLNLAPLLLSGFHSLRSSSVAQENEFAYFNIRQLMLRFSNLTAIKKAVVRYNEHYTSGETTSDQRLFNIDEKTLTFQPLLDLMPPEYEQAKQVLLKPLEFSKHGKSVAKADKELFIEVDDIGIKRPYNIKDLPSTLSNTQHNISNQSSGPIQIPIAELFEEATEMDLLDVKHSRRPGNWVSRLENILLEKPKENGGFSRADTLELAGLKHLIGLPGAGKTTLLMCLTRWLSRKDYKTAVVFPSVEVSRQYLTALKDYDVAAGLLTGQSQSTRARHAHNIAETIACADPLKGFAKEFAGSEYFSTHCVLPAFTDAMEDGINPTRNFCGKVKERTKSRDGSASKPVSRLCPLWGMCGYHKASRELIDVNVWLGHIASFDTLIPPHATQLHYRYFEHIAREFDVVIIDEADQVQSWLDDQGVSKLTLTGDSESFHADLQKRQNQMTVEHNYALGDPNIFNFTLTAMDFSRNSHMLVGTIQKLDEELRKQYQGIFLTSSRLINAIVSGDKAKSGLAEELEGIDSRFRQKEAITLLWESAANAAFYNRQDMAEQDTVEQLKIQRIAENLNFSEEEIKNQFKNLSSACRIWLTEERSSNRDIGMTRICTALSELAHRSQSPSFDKKVHLLVCVTFTIFSYKKLAPHSEALIEQGFLTPSHVEQRCSDDLLSYTTDNILGRLSGVRFFLDNRSSKHSELSSVKLQYAVFSGSPRSFIYHLHKSVPGVSRAPAVLLASATSYLEQSPAYHINRVPDYIVRACNNDERSDKSFFEFKPIPNASKPGTCLRYSGEALPSVREGNLRKMVSYLLKDGVDDSVVGKAITSFDSGERKRKAAFVVNSYQHCEMLKRHIDQRHPEWASKTVAVVKDVEAYDGAPGYVTNSQVEALGDMDNIELIIFPMGAIGRGTNIVFSKGTRARDAAIGTMYFLTRPHPSTDDLSLLISIAAQQSEEFNAETFSEDASFEDIATHHMTARNKAYDKVWRLLLNPLIASRLGDLMEPFTANISVSLLQTIGRGMRNSCRVQCFFVDAAWAKNSAKNDESILDTNETSMLVQLINILKSCVNHTDPIKRSVYEELYSAFLEPLSETQGLHYDKRNVKTLSPHYDAASESSLDGITTTEALLSDNT
ncbi:hypothetical protein NBRC116494_16250 [Aurantivibrio plasticivorans]